MTTLSTGTKRKDSEGSKVSAKMWTQREGAHPKLSLWFCTLQPLTIQSEWSSLTVLCRLIYIEELWGLVVFYYIYVHGVDTQYVTSPARVLGLNTSSYRTCLPYELMAGLQGKGSGKTKSCLLSHSSSHLYDLNSTEERRVCRSLCSLFWACSLFCWEILFQEANRIWHQKPIFSSSHLAAGSVGSTTANDNTSLLDKLFLIFNISTRLKHLSVFFFFFFSFKKRT